MIQKDTRRSSRADTSLWGAPVCRRNKAARENESTSPGRSVRRVELRRGPHLCTQSNGKTSNGQATDGSAAEMQLFAYRGTLSCKVVSPLVLSLFVLLSKKWGRGTTQKPQGSKRQRKVCVRGVLDQARDTTQSNPRRVRSGANRQR